MRAKINAEAANIYVKEHSIPGASVDITSQDGERWDWSECTIQYWLEDHPAVESDEWDDASDHDRSVIRKLTLDTPQGKVVVWSYNNNAWGFADAYDASASAAPQDVEEFCRQYADNVGVDVVENWVLEMAGYDAGDDDSAI